jgi:hypothetical protein
VVKALKFFQAEPTIYCLADHLLRVSTPKFVVAPCPREQQLQFAVRQRALALSDKCRRLDPQYKVDPSEQGDQA